MLKDAGHDCLATGCDVALDGEPITLSALEHRRVPAKALDAWKALVLARLGKVPKTAADTTGAARRVA